MKKLLVILVLFFAITPIFAQHNAGHNGKVLMIVSNPTVSEQTGWPIGVWASELTHPYWEFSEAGYAIDIASPLGGEIKIDGFSNPDDESGYSAFDYVSRGFLADPTKQELLKNSLKLSKVNPNDYKAIFVCGGQGPMYTFYENQELHKFFVDYYETGKPTAAICHGTSILLKTKLSNGKNLVEGKKWTGFANSEEQYADNYVGFQIQPFRIEDEAKKMPRTNFVTGTPFDAFAVRDGNLITGQQQNSGAAAARLILEAMEEDKNRYPTYVLVHGAWADESAWGFVRNQLAVHANVEVVNLPGHGVDLTPENQVKLNDYVKTVEAGINKYDGKVILVGHSLAGMIITQVAESIPNKIDKMVYVSAYLPRNGESITDLASKDTESLIGPNIVFNEDYTTGVVKKDFIVAGTCADCPNFMKEIIVKYHKDEPTTPMNEVAQVTSGKFGEVEKYYIHTSNDKAVGYELQKQMVKANGTIRKIFVMDTSHLPFVVQPQKFVGILTGIGEAR